VEEDTSPTIEIKHNRMLVRLRPGTNVETKQDIIAKWYRERIREAVLDLNEKWESIIGVKVARVFVQSMKTKWGSCNPGNRSIRLNTELAKKPRECFEYIVVHEMTHILERTHNARFIELMDRFMPQWRFYREELNRLPVRHEDWTY
jgi:predicted metal-dependent hydrolase